MKRRSREGQGQEARAERGEQVVSAAALRHGWPLALLLLAQDTENITTSTSGPTLHRSLDTAATAVLGSIGVVALILLLVGLLSVTLKKWRHERLFKKQQKHQTNFLHKPLELSCHADAIYSNVINLAPRKEDDFAVYANVPPFNCPRRTSPDHVEYASIVFH